MPKSGTFTNANEVILLCVTFWVRLTKWLPIVPSKLFGDIRRQVNILIFFVVIVKGKLEENDDIRGQKLTKGTCASFYPHSYSLLGSI
jgi:hypothetical protein